MVAGSFAFGFALVPLYDVICEAAGIRVNAAPSAMQASNAGEGREITLEFMSMIPPGSAFELKPEARSMKLQPGKLYEAKFLIKSRATVPLPARCSTMQTPSAASRRSSPRPIPSCRIPTAGEEFQTLRSKRQAFCPPKPKVLLSAAVKLRSRA